ncbi:UDP-N-acetylglucosamine 1-carboxyvinyltransferase [Anoxybacter fermentans]|uniref:UDP-N-acetylglucosamine 1-carboxyvinyltransferase n=1 Tax=Anoxybacter fermentans TaxID=1323375 RepID=A0A3S9SXT5_9FIRM|nr:UDP-N-acetylglucosamine 1-carboxyvinyltransferase [Anoxybacter fermentans]AZR73034.1 UDP-N-acetylglucosamine 1-carboxyvinyltransferase [Anoxybacter fermentans]
MLKYEIIGGKKLKGRIRISGAKNAVLPILAATVLSKGKNIIRDVPHLKDVEVMIEVLKYLGAKVCFEGSVLEVDTTDITVNEVPDHLMRKMRATVFLMGPLLGRFGKVKIFQPGGCSIGPRPINWHIKGLKSLNVEFKEGYGYISGQVKKLKGNEIHLDFPSVGTTENIMMGAVLAEGTTWIRNAAKEPEIVDLQNFLNGMGAKIRGAGTDVIKIEGVKELKTTDYTVIPDRIETGTFMIAAAVTGGDVVLENTIPEHVEPLIAKLNEAEVKVTCQDDKIHIQGNGRLKALEIKTLPYPGYPTDLQPQMMTALTIAEGTSIITETIFENRLKHAEELRRMGASIWVEGHTAIINGVPSLTGAAVEATDLRAGAALVIAGLAAEGKTTVYGVEHIQRGYENLEKKITQLGGQIHLLND